MYDVMNYKGDTFIHKYRRDDRSSTLSTYTDPSSTAVASVKLSAGHPVPHAMLLSLFGMTFSGLLGAVVLDMAGPLFSELS